MKYRVIVKFKVFPFSSYIDAYSFKSQNGGTMYELCYEQR